jgi:hypothetical protein
VTFTGTRYPQRVVHDRSVTCVDGEVAVSDSNAIEVLRKLPPEVGVRASAGPPPSTWRRDHCHAEAPKMPTVCH